MHRTRTFKQTKFPPEVLRKGHEQLHGILPKLEDEARNSDFRVSVDYDEAWTHDTEAEFFADYRRDHDQSTYERSYYQERTRYWLRVSFNYGKTDVTVGAKTRAEIEHVMQVFEDSAESARLPDPPRPAEPPPSRPTIFIGHGRDPQWRDLKDHLADKHQLDVQAYESGARAGHGIRDILDDLVRTSSFAVLILTGEDEMAGGGIRARQNVVHELGLFQGKLGFTRAIALLEEGTEEFSNIHGINQVRFAKGNIHATFGEVLATIRREFGPG
ncbi:nucleotide-binding protein [Longimicrobium sp.]|jgi:predicted nucleotide-binding protein|uniref:nucleotide-binding protein n=1 Tax=Longimicrobium sp. TaxID=2029185 RepID=UPI002F94F719